MKSIDLEPETKKGAGCIIYATSTNNFLLIQRSEYVPAPLSWGLPGGTVEKNESPEDAARREVFEEIGFDLKHIPLELIYTNEYHIPRFKFYNYGCVIQHEFEPVLSWESSDSGWFNIDDLPEGLHTGLEQLFANEQAARRLRLFIESKKELDSDNK